LASLTTSVLAERFTGPATTLRQAVENGTQKGGLGEMKKVLTNFFWYFEEIGEVPEDTNYGLLANLTGQGITE
jgi:hypothetical protein